MTALLSIQRLSPDNSPFPAYFVASTAPINVEDRQTNGIPDPKDSIDEMCRHLKSYKDDAEVLIVIHGYNTSRAGVKDWYESIYRHLASHHSRSRAKGFLLIGYRWPSEQIKPQDSEIQEEGGSFRAKRKAAKKALPVILGKISRLGTFGLIGGIGGSLISIVAIALQAANAVIFLIIFSTLTVLSLVAVSPIFTILILRLVGYFRDNYRANNFGVSDLVELIRQIDKTLIQSGIQSGSEEEESDPKIDWHHNRIKLSFIGHSMGGFVVTNTIRILSDVFDPQSVGSVDATAPQKHPSSFVGNVFSLSRLVLVSPDIPAETIISGRANFLQSSLRRFEEAYLFSNEGDMALRLASTAANYFSYPSSTQDGGYRLGNVTVRNSIEPRSKSKPARKKDLQEGAAMPSESYGVIARLPDGQLVSLKDGQAVAFPDHTYPLDYLYIRAQIPLSQRQQAIALAPNEKPIGESFSFFDCTDYAEPYIDRQGREKTVGIVSHALRKQALTFQDYVSLTIDYFTNKIDTHGGYFSNGETNPKKGVRPEASFTKLTIYGLACLGFEKFLLELPEQSMFNAYQTLFAQILEELHSQSSSLTAKQQEKIALSYILSSICRDKGIQVLLAQERYTLDILDTKSDL